MRVLRPRQVVPAALAVGASILAAGCDFGSVNDPPQAAAGHPTLGQDSAAAEAAPRSEVPEPSEPVLVQNDEPAEPVVAPSPGDHEVALASASRSAEATGNGGTKLPSITDPAADPSRYPGGVVPASPTAEPLPGGPRLLVPERTFRLEGRPRALRVTYDDLDLLRVLNMGDPLPSKETVLEMMPGWLKELDGKTVRLRGFMYPAYEQELSAFILTRDTGVCCFGPNPKVYYLVGVKLKEGTRTRYIENRPFDVVGTFHIVPVYTDGQWYQLYKMSDAVVIN
jgi:hypothetical protein